MAKVAPPEPGASSRQKQIANPQWTLDTRKAHRAESVTLGTACSGSLCVLRIVGPAQTPRH